MTIIGYWNKLTQRDGLNCLDPNIRTPLMIEAECLADMLKAHQPKRPLGLGPNQLAWCRANLGNFAKYEQQVLASKGERQAELAEKKECGL